jgi:hypothetical protein
MAVHARLVAQIAQVDLKRAQAFARQRGKVAGLKQRQGGMHGYSCVFD